MQELIKIACAEIGVKEIPGQAHNARILQYASEAGFQDVKDDETAWCSIFLSWCCLKAGLKRSTKLNARSWLAVGTVTTQPEPGDIIVYWRKAIESWEGHVGIYMGTSSDGSRCYTLRVAARQSTAPPPRAPRKGQRADQTRAPGHST